MQLEMVLNEEEKKERFRASLLKKKREEAFDGTASSQARFEEGSSTVTADSNIVEPSHSTSPQRFIEFPRTNSIPRALILPSQVTGSSYNNRPTGTVAPLQNPSSSHPWKPAPLQSMLETKQNTSVSSRFEQNTSFSSRSEQNTSLSSGFEQKNISQYSRMGQEPNPLSSIFVQNTTPRPILNSPHSRLVPTQIKQERTPDATAYPPYKNMPPLQPVNTSENFSSFYQSSSYPPFSHNDHDSCESVILMSRRKTQEELKVTCVKDYQGGSELEALKSEYIIDTKDFELLDSGDICDDELIFKYIHKKFGSKNRELAPVVKNTETFVSEFDPLEGTSRETELSNR
jgi:hypothetical protein